jgi:hypothetical protein
MLLDVRQLLPMGLPATPASQSERRPSALYTSRASTQVMSLKVGRRGGGGSRTEAGRNAQLSAELFAYPGLHLQRLQSGPPVGMSLSQFSHTTVRAWIC